MPPEVRRPRAALVTGQDFSYPYNNYIITLQPGTLMIILNFILGENPIRKRRLRPDWGRRARINRPICLLPQKTKFALKGRACFLRIA
jgi:hypothetical protein